MKTTPYYKYCNEKYGKGNYTSWLGIRLDEPRRLKPKEGYRYLAEISPMSKEQIIGWWSDMPFDLEIDEWLGNCVFCIKKGINKVAVAIKQESELAKEFNEMLSHANNENRNHGESMYRGKLSFDGVAEFFADSSAETVIAGMRNRRGCAVEQGESCEVFGCQGDLFDQ